MLLEDVQRYPKIHVHYLVFLQHSTFGKCRQMFHKRGDNNVPTRHCTVVKNKQTRHSDSSNGNQCVWGSMKLTKYDHVIADLQRKRIRELCIFQQMFAAEILLSRGELKALLTRKRSFVRMVERQADEASVWIWRKREKQWGT